MICVVRSGERGYRQAPAVRIRPSGNSGMYKSRAYRWQVFPLVLGGLLPLVGCEKGPAERAGERVDNAARAVRDTVNPPSGPLEAAGRKIDDATRRSP